MGVWEKENKNIVFSVKEYFFIFIVLISNKNISKDNFFLIYLDELLFNVFVVN